MITKPSTDQWGFNDTTNVTTAEALSHFSFRATAAEVTMANTKAVELLKNSPYKDKLGSAGALPETACRPMQKQLPALVSPHLGNSVDLGSQLAASGPALAPDKLDQIAALPIGGPRETRSVDRQRGAAEVQAGRSAFGARENAV